MNYRRAGCKLWDWKPGDTNTLKYPNIVAVLHQVFIYLSVDSVSSSWRGLSGVPSPPPPTPPPALITSPLKLREHTAGGVQNALAERFQVWRRRKNLYLCYFHSLGNYRAHKALLIPRSWTQEQQYVFIHNVCSSVCVSSHGRRSPSVFICQIKASDGEAPVYN